MLHARRETASGRMEKLAVLAPVPKQKVSIVEREDPGWTVWLDSQGDGVLERLGVADVAE